MSNEEIHQHAEGDGVSFKDCTVAGVPIPDSGTFASNDQVANTYSSDESEGVSMAHAVGEKREHRAGAAQQYSRANDNEGSNVPKVPTPNSGIFASNDQVANAYSSDEPEGVSMAHAVRFVLAEVTDFGVGPKADLAGPVTLMSGTTGHFTLTDYEGVEYDIFVRLRPS